MFSAWPTSFPFSLILSVAFSFSFPTPFKIYPSQGFFFPFLPPQQVIRRLPRSSIAPVGDLRTGVIYKQVLMLLTTSSIQCPSLVISVLVSSCHKVTPHLFFILSSYIILMSFANLSCPNRLLSAGGPVGSCHLPISYSSWQGHPLLCLQWP